MLCALLTVVGAVQVWASGTYEPPTGGDTWLKSTVELKPTSADPDASGKAAFMCNADETQHQATAAAKGLATNGVYSLWLIRLDSKDRSGKTDANGKLAFATSLPWCPASKGWTVCAVKHHANGNAADVDHAVTVLKGDLKAASD
ncbi:MAG: hypothetical protein FJX74_22230 [Armatimonadetes bacterium]|nr:hypothetical protein [Armatimonadota bacterium]